MSTDEKLSHLKPLAFHGSFSCEKCGCAYQPARVPDLEACSVHQTLDVDKFPKPGKQLQQPPEIHSSVGELQEEESGSASTPYPR